jgi:hypothetical protein
MDPEQIQHMKRLEKENARLSRLVLDVQLENTLVLQMAHNAGQAGSRKSQGVDRPGCATASAPCICGPGAFSTAASFRAGA